MRTEIDHKETWMLGYARRHNLLNSVVWVAIAVLAVGIGAAQNLPATVPSTLPGAPAIRLPGLSELSLSGPAAPADRPKEQPGNIVATGLDGAEIASVQMVRSAGPRRVTLEQVKQQSANRAANPIAYMSHLSVEAAKQHRLAVRADYFPKFGATFTNLHFTDFLGEIVEIRRPLLGTLSQVPAEIINQDQTIAALTFVQPITPLLQVRQAVRIARADERIAMAKAAATVSKNARDTQVEEAYFKLLIAQRQLISAEWKLRSGETRTLYASASGELVGARGQEAGTMEAAKSFETAKATVRELTAALDRLIAWPDDTELELAVPEPLIENISLQDVSDKSSAANPALVEAQETVVKARAAQSLAKLAYVPSVAAVSGYLFQNAFPAVNSNFGYGGVMASYTLFDFGKREHTVKEAHAQLEMAETALQLTKAKLAADVKKSYLDLERSRQLSQVAQKMGSSAAVLMRVSADSESLEVRAARAEVEAEMIEADFAHRQAFRHLNALISPER